MRPAFLKNQMIILAVGCFLTLGWTNISNADGCWGSSRGGWGSGGGSFGSRGGLLSNQPVRNLLAAVGDRVGSGLSNLGNGIADVLQRQPLRNALLSGGSSGGSSWGGSRGGIGSTGNRLVGRGWGSCGGWGCSGGSYASSGSLLSSPISAPAYVSAPSYISTPAFVSEPTGIISTGSLLDLPIVTTGGYGSAGSVASYAAAGPAIGLGYGHGATGAVGLTNTTVSGASLNQIETSTHVLDYGYYGNQYGDIGASTNSVMVDNALITGPMLEPQQGSGSVIESPSELDFPSEFDGGSGGSESAPEDAFGAEEDDSVYLPRGKAVLSLNVPRDAKVYINDKLTRTGGTLRSYVSRNLAFGEPYRYRVRVVSQFDGKEVTKKREVTMRGGTREEFAFNFEPIVTRVALNVPEDAKVVIDGKETSATGAFRSFSTEKLKAGKWEDYSVEVSVVRGGKTLTKRESFDLGAGEFRFLEFEFGQTAASSVAAK